MKVHRPASLDEALVLLDTRPPPVPFAGGTDLMVSWHARSRDELALLDLSRLRELQVVRLTDESLELGALATYWDVLCSAEVCRGFPLLAVAARQVGAIQIQTRGTWAGNIANGSPAADGVPVLMAYDGTVELRSRGSRREVRLDAYFTGYKQSVRSRAELITAIRLPRRTRAVEWFHKVGARRAQAIAKVGVAVVRDALGWRVAVNSVAPAVCRCRHLEQALDEGRGFQTVQDLRRVLAADISPITDLRSTAEYRAEVLARLIYHGLQELHSEPGCV